MPGYKGQTGSSTNIEKPRTAKQKMDQSIHKKRLRKNTEFYTTYYCSNCKNKFEFPFKLESGVNCCPDCMMKQGKFIEVQETKSYRLKDKSVSKSKTKKKRKK